MAPTAADQHSRQQYPQPEYPEQTQMDQHPGLVCLASQEASYVNGETLGVTGGQPLP